MSHIVRFIVVKASPDKCAEIERVWNQECGPLMRRLPGCISEELLHCVEDPSEYISVAEWESRQAIDAYLASPEHQEIKRHTRGITGVSVAVKTYEVIAAK
jgi:heme-degrading monooxygenase HmoA